MCIRANCGLIGHLLDQCTFTVKPLFSLLRSAFLPPRPAYQLFNLSPSKPFKSAFLIFHLSNQLFSILALHSNQICFTTFQFFHFLGFWLFSFSAFLLFNFLAFWLFTFSPFLLSIFQLFCSCTSPLFSFSAC